jgi:PhnB protein
MKSVTAYLNFDGNCRHAMSFYRECLDTKLHLNAYPDSSGQPSRDPAARIMHSQLLHDGAPILMASDTPPGGGSLKPGNNNFSVSIHCDSLDEIERLFSALGQNGKVRMPLRDMPWGSRLGMLTDQFGIQWLLNCDLPSEGSGHDNH